jgi:hypothetical protein
MELFVFEDIDEVRFDSPASIRVRMWTKLEIGKPWNTDGWLMGLQPT